MDKNFFYDPIRKVCYEPFAAHYAHKYQRRFSEHAMKVVALDLSLLAVIAGLVTFSIFADELFPTPPAPVLVNLELQAEDAAVSGKPADYALTYRNDSTQTLGCVQLKVHLPADTVVEGGPPTIEGDDDACIVDTESMGQLTAPEARHDVLVFPQSGLAPGESRTVTIRATTYGATGTAKAARAEISYWEEGATEPTRIALRREWPIAGSVLSLRVDGPEVIARGRTHDITVSYANDGAPILENVAVRVTPPEDFVVTSTTPAPDADGEWRVGHLERGAGGRIALQGYFRTTQNSAVVAPTFAVEGYADVLGTRTIVEGIRHNVDPRAGDLAFSIETAPLGRAAMLPGETLYATIRYRNDGDRSLSDLRVTLDPGAAYWDPHQSGPFMWDGSSDPSLAELAPGAEGTLVAAIVIPRDISRAMLGDDAFPELYVAATAEYRLEGDALPVRADTAVVHMPISARMELDAVAAYFTPGGDQLGTGPLPPKVGETTKYRVILSPSVSTSEAKDLTVTARLPEGVEWTGRTSVSAGGALDYLPSTRTVRWQVGRIPAWTGIDGPQAIASFEVAVTPGEDDAGSAMTMVTGLEAHAQDAVTGLALHATAPELRTDATGDPRTEGKGTVSP